MSVRGDSSLVSAGVPTSRLAVVIADTGVCVAPDLPVGLAELTVVERLAASVEPLADMLERAAAETASNADHLDGFVRVLEERNLLGGEPSVPSEMYAPRDASAPPVDDDEPLLLESPIMFRVGRDGFEALDHDGRLRIRISARSLLAAAQLARPTSLAQLRELNVAAGIRLTDERLEQLVDDLRRAGLLSLAGGSMPQSVAADQNMAKMRRALHLQYAIKQSVDEHERVERERRETTGIARTRVVPVAFDMMFPPLGLGLIIATAKAYEGGRLDDEFHFCPNWMTDRDQIAEMAKEPSVFLFSTYLWSYGQCLETSKLVKEINPANVTVFGGPSTPKYEGDCREFFANHPHVDVTVRGEGEDTATALLAALAGKLGGAMREDSQPDLSVLADVAGLTYRDGDRIVRTADRDRISDLDTVPSPYLTGLFDAYTQVEGIDVILETNRGCPYGCTFCDWGSATLSRIRKYDIDRVYAELAWCAVHKVSSIAPADSNFGIWSRDVDITRKLTELKTEHGYPKGFGVNFAKNTAKHLRTIIQLLIDAGIFTYGLLSLQSMDEDTLNAIERQNIRLEKYDELATEFRRAGLPLFVDLMVGLPGQTGRSFRNDVQECVDREVQMRIPITTMLVNSPMNAPEYRRKFKIITNFSPLDPVHGATVVETSTFTRADYNEMLDLRRVVLLAEDLGVFRHIARYLRGDTGMREIDFYDQLRRSINAEPDRWPILSLTLKVLPDRAMPPVSWRLAFDELHDWIVTHLGVPDDDSLATALTVQHALLPCRDRALPLTLNLPHDYAAWYQQMYDAKNNGNRNDWPDIVPKLRSFGPAPFRIDDPDRIAHWWTGLPVDMSGYGIHWELESPIARPLIKMSTKASQGGSATA